MPGNIDEISQLINLYRSSHQIPGMAFSMVDNGEVIYAQGFGTAHADSPYNLVSPDTVFSIQGMTESFTACALFHLQEHSSFRLDKPIGEYIPSFKHKNAKEITTVHLLTHTAGFQEPYNLTPLLDKRFYRFIKNMPEYKPMLENMPEQFKNSEVTYADVMSYLESLELKIKPGETFQRFDDGYMIAAKVLENVSGMSWREYIMTHILQPLGMVNTTIHEPEHLDDKKLAKYYMKGIGDPIQTPTPYNKIGAPVQSIFSTVSDLSAFLKAQMVSDELFPLSSLMRLHTPYVKIDQSKCYGLGWQINNGQGMGVVEQTGNHLGMSSSISFIPEEKFGIVLLCNMDMIQLNKLALRIMKRWFK